MKPTTDAGRALLAVYAHDPQFLADILAIEREAADKAVTRVLDALAGVAAEHASGDEWPHTARFGGDALLRDIEAFIQQHRPKGGPG